MARELSTVGVVGLGTMGAGIAEVLARAGLTVIGIEVDDEGVERGRANLERSTARAVSRGKLTDDERDALIGLVTYSTALTDLADVDLVIEAVPERLETKVELLATLDGICRPDTILATNTSALSVTRLAVATSRPKQVVGMHWFNPAPVMGLVEVVKTVMTDPTVADDVQALATRVGKTVAAVGDQAGFIANALLFGYLNNALTMWEAGYASREDIDAAMRFGCGHKMGPLALLDLIGLDSALEILETIYAEGRDHRLAPAPILSKLVTAGFTGRKAGRGIYTYAGVGSPEVIAGGETSGWPTAPGRTISKVAVIGTGTMATGIIEVLAKTGYEVLYRARGAEKVAAVGKALGKSLDRQVERGKLTAEAREDLLGRITGTSDIADLADCDLVVEAVAEDLAVKTAIFAELDQHMKPGAVLATTTSSLPVIALAQATTRPADVVGMHWFNPAPLMRLVEVVPTVVTSDDVVATVREVSLRAKKHPVLCGDRGGFIVNALLFPYLNDAVKMLAAHYATLEDIDNAMTTGCGHPMGPFTLMDVVGLDVTLAIEQVLENEFREPGLRPAPMLEHLVTAGYLGRKTGRGFKDYAKK